MREKSFDSINVVPFIDIMLVLLTIVLATATFIKTGVIPVNLPAVAESEQMPESIIIDISADGQMYYGPEPHTAEQLRAVLENTSRDSHITVRADKTSEIQPFASLMSLLRECGFEKVNLQTEVTN